MDWAGWGRVGLALGVGEFLFPSFKQKVSQGFSGERPAPGGVPLPGIPGRGVSLVCVCTRACSCVCADWLYNYIERTW